MFENRLYRFCFLFLIAASFAWTSSAQDTAQKEKDTSGTDSEDEKEAADTAPDEADEETGGEDEAAPDEEADEAEKATGDEAAEDEEEKEEGEEDEEGGKEDDFDEENEDVEETSPSELKAPKTVDLDMSALGQMDPEKELAEGGPVDESDAVASTEADWTERELDILELHGYYRVRPELYHKFNIRHDDAVYNLTIAQETRGYKNGTLTGANMRFRLDPTLNISEEIRVKSQIDFLDNVMLGSTPRYFQSYGAQDGTTLEVGRVQGWDMGPPDASQMVVVRRAWAEVMTPLGQLRFGRMGDHFGLGMLHNAGNGIQNDFGDTVDRLMFAAKINNWLIAPAFDFPSEGMSASDASGRPFDVSQLDDAYRLVGIFAYKHDEEEQAAMLKRSDWLINTGLYFSYRWQVLSFENNAQSDGLYDPALDEYLAAEDLADEDAEPPDNGYYGFYRRELWTIEPDLWFQLLYKTFHFELEAALIFGKLGNPSTSPTEADELNPLTLLQGGGVLQIDYGLLSDALRIGLEFGYAHGDEQVETIRAPANYDQRDDDDTFTAFSFNPAYNTDLILHHHILGSVSQSFYFDAWLQYDFLKNPMGRKLGIRADVLYSRAIYEASAIGSSANLGVELNAQVNYISEDGFYAGLAYGVLFPLGAFKGDPDGPESDRYVRSTDLTVPQTIQTILGVVF